MVGPGVELTAQMAPERRLRSSGVALCGGHLVKPFGRNSGFLPPRWLWPNSGVVMRPRVAGLVGRQ